eukprot:TRINITY_DN9289_c0_g1_i1.p1 TRINITY_DN9289_c0_g1~~TRINITY_DN9289_c0_g1_i1.p1  ORF type:complete len:617 (-),score=195.28 TRINITY_DN9289_c0_g1_i1:42-1856(-)
MSLQKIIVQTQVRSSLTINKRNLRGRRSERFFRRNEQRRLAVGLGVKRFYAQYNVPGAFELKMPALSPTMTEGKIIDWQVAVGDTISMGDVLATIETDKANMEFESPEDGVLAKIIVPEGMAQFDEVIAVLVPEESDVDKLQVVEGGEEKSGSKSESKSEPKSSEAPKKAESKSKQQAPTVPHLVLELPSLSPNMDEGKIISWNKKPGDEINAGDVICEIETDKAVMPFEAVEDGFLASILVQEGESAPLQTPIGIVVESADDIDAVKGYNPTMESAETETEPEASEEPAKKTTSESKSAPAQSTSTQTGGRVFASPLARKLAAEKGYEINSITGTGPDGRIIKADVEEFTPSASKSSTKAAPKSGSAPSTPGVYPEFEDTDVTSVRKVIAQRLTSSKQNIPHYYLTMECRFNALMELREQLNKMGEGVYKLSVNDFIMKAAASSMRAVPVVNAEWRDTAIRQYNDVNINVAVSTDRGLITPVVRNVNKKSLSEISNGVKALAGKARDSSLSVTDLEGGTFTISNLGMFGITQFAAVINPPQAAILAVGAPTKKLVLNQEGNPEEATFVNFTLSCDHRVIDGAVGAQWLQEFKKIIENPLSLMV